MATVEQCREALTGIAAQLGAEPEAVGRVNLNRSLSCHIRDLNASFHGRLEGGRIVDLTDGDDPRAQIRLSVGSDDLLALIAGQLNFAAAWASGRVSRVISR